MSLPYLRAADGKALERGRATLERAIGERADMQALLGIGIACLRLIAGSDGAECAHPRAEAAEALRKIEKTGA